MALRLRRSILLATVVALALSVLACGPRTPRRGSPARAVPTPDRLEAAWSACEAELEESLNQMDLDRAKRALDKFSHEIASMASDSSAAQQRARERLDDGRQRLAKARERFKLEQITAQIEKDIVKGAFEQARLILDLYLNSSHPSSWAETKVGELHDKIDEAERTSQAAQNPPTVPIGSTSPVPQVTGMSFVHIPGGTYRIGSPEGEPGRDAQQDLEPIPIRLDTYFISTTEVTQEAFSAVIPRSWDRYIHDRRPAHSVSYGEAKQYCERLGDLDPVFFYSLPSELEWEVACRAQREPAAGPVGVAQGEMGRFLYGLDAASQALQRYAFFQPNHLQPGPMVVAQKQPNPLGLYDMHGNVSEWCRKAEQISHTYAGMLLRQPVRGGSVLSKYARCRAGARAFEPADSQRATIGFRVVCRRR